MRAISAAEKKTDSVFLYGPKLNKGLKLNRGGQVGCTSVSFDSLNYAQVGDQYYL